MKFALFHFAIFVIACLFCGCVGIYDDVSQLVNMARCNLRVGILADTRLLPPHSDKLFEKTLRYFNERDCDLVVIAGGVTQDGGLGQRRCLKRIWDKVFPNGRRRDGQAVSLFVVTGEGDTAKVFEDAMGKPPAPVFSREVKGYTFIGANWKDATQVDAWALKPFLANVGADKPFFYVQNLVPYATCCPNVGRPFVIDGGKVSYMLSKHPNAIAICGRAYTPLTDETAFWRGDFTCVNAGSFSCAKMRGEKGAVRKDAHHGLVMSVYDSSVVFERIDFGVEAKKKQVGRFADTGVYVEKLGADWRVDLPARPASRPETPAPQFWGDTRLMVFPSAKVVSVRFPPVLAKHTGVRAYAYEIKVEGVDGLERTVYSSACCMSEDREDKAVSCDFVRDKLPKGTVRFEVTPVDSFGKRGRPITGETQL